MIEQYENAQFSFSSCRNGVRGTLRSEKWQKVAPGPGPGRGPGGPLREPEKWLFGTKNHEKTGFFWKKTGSAEKNAKKMHFFSTFLVVFSAFLLVYGGE